MQAGRARVVVAIVILVVWAAITFNFGRDWGGEHRPLEDAVNAGFNWNLFFAGLFLAAALAVFRWRDVGLAAPRPHTLELLWLPILFIVLFFAVAVLIGLPPLSILAIMLVNSLIVGWSEEMAFRGILFSALRTWIAIWPAIIVTTVLFGAVHVLNGFGTGDWGNAVIQACTAAMSGLIFMAILIRTGSIIPAMAVHAFWDYGLFTMSAALRGHSGEAPAAEAGIAVLLVPFALALPNFLYALYLLRNVRSEPG